jgi:hypothetical protein
MPELATATRRALTRKIILVLVSLQNELRVLIAGAREAHGNAGISPRHRDGLATSSDQAVTNALPESESYRRAYICMQ